MTTPQSEAMRFTPTLRAADRRLVELHGERVYLSTEQYERVLRHAIGVVKTLLDARVVVDES